MTTRTHIGVEAHRLLSGTMRRSLLALAKNAKAYVAPFVLNDLEHARLVIRDGSGRIHLTRPGLVVAEALEAEE